MSEVIKKGDFVKISYTGRMDDGTVFDTTDEALAKEHNVYNTGARYGSEIIVVGAGHTVAGLDEDLEGKEVGYKGKVTVPPEKGFGIRNPELIEVFPITRFQDKPYPGMKVRIDNRFGVVIRVIGRRVQVDFNKFLAGQTLEYEYNIEEKIDKTEEQIAGLFGLYAGRDLKVELVDGRANIDIPLELTFNNRWLMSKRQIASDILTYTSVKEVNYIEKYTQETLRPTSEPMEPPKEDTG
jgi:FKBP-type peptidyl-prolyl cis-trans isomerase SlyD